MDELKILVLVGIIWCIWELVIRPVYIRRCYRNAGKGISIPEGMTNQILMDLLRDKLDCDLVKQVFINERGNVAVGGKFGITELVIGEDGLLHITNEEKFMRSETKDMRNYEQANCLNAYIQKIFEPNAPVNPYKKLQSIKLDCITRKCTIAVIALILVAMGYYDLHEKGVVGSPENKLKNKYLTEYSQEITLGDAIDSFLESPKWNSYSEKGQQFVTVTGNCTYGEEKVNVCITFEVLEDSVLETMEINGKEVSNYVLESFFKEVYSE